jgi:hypothetical protein
MDVWALVFKNIFFRFLINKFAFDDKYYFVAAVSKAQGHYVKDVDFDLREECFSRGQSHADC